MGDVSFLTLRHDGKGRFRAMLASRPSVRRIAAAPVRFAKLYHLTLSPRMRQEPFEAHGHITF